MKNVRIKIAMTENDLKQWQLAKLMGIHEGSLSRRFREELPEEEQDRIIELIRKNAKPEGKK